MAAPFVMTPVAPSNGRQQRRVLNEREKVEQAMNSLAAAGVLRGGSNKWTPKQMALVAEVIKRCHQPEHSDVDLAPDEVAFIGGFPEEIQPIIYRAYQNDKKGHRSSVTEEEAQAQANAFWESQKRCVGNFRLEAAAMLDEAEGVIRQIETTLTTWRLPKEEMTEAEMERLVMNRRSDRHWALRQLVIERPGRLFIADDDAVYPVQYPTDEAEYESRALSQQDTPANPWSEDRLLNHPYFEAVRAVYGERLQPVIDFVQCPSCDSEHKSSASAAGCDLDDGESGL